MSTEKFGIVIGVDFGTTYSGLSFIHTAATKPEVRIIREWPDYLSEQFKHRSEKVPTEIAYPSNGNPRWGYQIEPGEHRYSNFKLLLQQTPPATKFDDANLSLQATLPPGKKAVDLCTDFLRLLNEYLLECLKSNYDRRLDLATTPFHYVLTTPADWSTEAQELTKQAAVAAGMGERQSDDTLSMTTEPLAAATCVLRYLVEEIPVTSQDLVGNRVLVCDAGGGTVDLITYKIDSVRPLKISEIVGSKAGRCGSVAIDKAYLDHVASRVGANVFQNWSPARTDPRNQLMSEFIAAKHNFPDRMDNSGNATGMPKILRIGGRGDEENVGVITLTNADMVDLFAPTMRRIRALISEQLHKCSTEGGRIDRIFLVGGFSGSNYLQSLCDHWMKDDDFAAVLAPNAVLTIPRDSWTAVVRGAAEHGMQQIVTSRVLNKHYGIRLSNIYDEKEHSGHSESDIYVYEFSGKKMTRDCANWFAAKGNMVRDETEFDLPFVCSYGVVEIELLTCAFDAAPSRFSNRRVLKNGQITLDMTKIPKSVFAQKTINKGWLGLGGKTIYEASGFVTVKVLSGELQFKCKMRDGKEIPGSTVTLNV